MKEPPLIYFEARRLKFPSRDIIPADLRRGVAFALWATVAWILWTWMPWFYWLTMALLPVAALVLVEAEWLRSKAGKRVLAICAGVLIAHVIWALIRIRFYDAAQIGTYWQDDHNYFNEARALAAAWLDGNFPQIWLKGPPPYLGTLHIGYHRPLATMFMAFGASTFTGLLLNAVSLCWVPLLCALAAKYLFIDDQSLVRDKSDVPKHRLQIKLAQVPLATAVLVALHPAQFYWTSFLMKDAWTTFTFWVGMVLVLGAVRRHSLVLAVAALMVLPYLATVRIYAGASIVIGLLLLPGLRISTRQFISGLSIVLVLLVLVLGYTERGSAVFAQVRDSIAALAPVGASGPLDIFKQLAAGVPRLFLSPYGWIILPEPTPMYGMYPGMWFMYLIGYPLGFAGLYVAVRRNVRLCVIPITAFGLAALLFLTAAYGGNASRQRYYLEYIFLVFAAFGLKHPSRRWIAGILILELIWAIGQLVALRA